MNNLDQLLKKNKGKVLLGIVAHPDDESFLTGALFLKAKQQEIKTIVICLTQGARGQNSYKKGNLKSIRTDELIKAASILKIDEVLQWNYSDTILHSEISKWKPLLQLEIEKIKPALIVTFDHSGYSGHPDHIAISVEVIKLIKKMNDLKTSLILRVPDNADKKHFKNSASIEYADTATHVLKFGIREAIKRVKAIYTHKSQMPSVRYKLHILDRYLFTHFELYHLVNIKSRRPVRLVVQK